MTAEPDTDSRPPPSKLWLLVPPLVLAGTDIVITLLGQRDIYWQGAFSLGDEASPPFAWLIQQHPIWFIAGTHACLAVFCAIILLLPRRGAMLASAAVTLGHAWGASTWLAWHIGPAYSYWTSLAIIILSAVMLVTVWERSCRGAAAPVAGRRTYLAALAAIALIAVAHYGLAYALTARAGRPTLTCGPGLKSIGQSMLQSSQPTSQPATTQVSD